jgi:hypothetical protein
MLRFCHKVKWQAGRQSGNARPGQGQGQICSDRQALGKLIETLPVV